MKKKISTIIKNRIHKFNKGLYLVLCVIKKVIKKDNEYIDAVYQLNSNPDYIKIIHNGKNNAQRIMFIINDQDRSVGFCAEIMDVLRRLIYAHDMGFFPVIIFTENFLYYDKEMNEECGNPFEYYFDHVGEKKDIESVNVVISGRFHADYIEHKYGIDSYVYNYNYDSNLSEIIGVVVNKYLRLKKEIIEDCENKLNKTNNKKILAVHYRGTDYKEGFNLHPVMVKMEQTIMAIDSILKTGKYESIFLATDDLKMSKEIKQRYAKKVIIFDDVYRSDENISVAFSKDNRKFHHYKLGYEIVRDMYTLSLCDGLVAGKSNVSCLANIFKISRKEKYEDMIIIDNGMNSNDRNHYDSVKKLLI